MFEYVRTSPCPRTNAPGGSETATGFPYRLAVIAVLVMASLVVLSLDEGRQFDPLGERKRLNTQLQSIETRRRDVAERKVKLETLWTQAEDGAIPTERLPPIWQAPFTFNSLDEWRAAARRRLKRCEEEHQGLADDEQRIRAEIASLPPNEAHRVSLLRRVMNGVLGNFEPRRED